MDIRDFIIRELNQREELSKPFKEKVEIEPDYQSDDFNEEIKVDKNIVIDYLMKSGYELTQENYERAEQMLLSMESNKLKYTLDNAGKAPNKSYKTVDHLYDLSVDELNSLLNIAVLNALNSINENTKPIKPVQYEYEIEVIRDLDGGTNVKRLQTILKKYSEEGYRVISIFTNELGKNSMSVGSLGINSTADQVVVVFERPIYK